MIKVLMERRVAKRNYNKLLDHLIDLRTAALHQPGYISGETLVKGTDPIDVMTISTWMSEDHWKAWTTARVRIELNDIINRLIEGDAKVSVYKVSFDED
jgi:heme oxygenase (mycobilin-producing)